MILGVGTDLANIDRIAATLDRFGDRFRNRVFTQTEQSKAERRKDVAGTYAKRWAAKEAFLKALGRDVKGLPYRDIEVLQASAGRQSMVIDGLAAAALASAGGRHIHLSISLDGGYALASVILES